jgi:uncharacterized protein
MKLKTLQRDATTRVADRGEFEALAATYAVDRGRDQIVPGAFDATIRRWKDSGRRIPLHWNHGVAAADIIGTVDPASMREVSGGLYVEGRLDLESSDTAREAWRSMKNDAVALSFGYVALQEQRRADGIKELLELDLFEISVTPSPMNPDTRFLSLKSTSRPVDDDTLRRKWQAFVRLMGSETLARAVLGLPFGARTRKTEHAKPRSV